MINSIKIFLCRADEPVVHEQGDAEQSNNEDSEPLSEDEYDIDNGDLIPAEGGSHFEQPANANENHGQDPLELPAIENKHRVDEPVQADGNAGSAGAADDSVIEIFESFEEFKEEIEDETAQPISETVSADGNAGNAGAEGDSEIEMYESYEELKEEPFEMQRLRESLDISGDSDCVMIGGYVESKVEVEDDETN